MFGLTVVLLEPLQLYALVMTQVQKDKLENMLQNVDYFVRSIIIAKT